MASGDVYKLDLLSTWDGEVAMRNTFYYALSNAVSGVSQRCFEGFEEDVLPKLKALAPTHITFDKIDVVCLKTPTDFYSEILVGQVGTRTQDPAGLKAPSFLALQFVGNRAGPGTRNARKRFAFLYEADFDGNEIEASLLGSTAVTQLQTAMQGAISFATITFNPVVCAHPTPLGVQPIVRFPITSYTASARLSTQNTRKD